MEKQIKRLTMMQELVEGIKLAEQHGLMNVRQTLLFRLRNLCLEYCYDYDVVQLDGISDYFEEQEVHTARDGAARPIDFAPVGHPSNGAEGGGDLER